MNIKKWPYWLKSGFLFGIIGGLIIAILPEEFINIASAQWYLAGIVEPVFLIFMGICIIFNIDFVSNSEDAIHLFILDMVGIFSYFVVFFLIGSLIGSISRLIKSKKTKK
ncbi:MAG: hypothetical protein GY853_05465 [PVC group bacterium]|nr:hypothetical protein [PVC group bacterium]